MYTIIFDYKGGTYVSQLYAKDEYLACLKWAQDLDTKEIEYIGERLKKKLLSELSDEDNRPLLLKGMLNVWFTMIALNGNAFIHIIKTYL
ncbi:hypothetical protein E0494_02895 [Marinilabiliaceae bacterium JC040]|nr:hypothetical protein [Marinilabiliaceae bacterium JC040]